MPIPFRCVFAALVQLAVIPCSHALDRAAIRTLVDQTIRPVMAEHGVPGMAVALTVDGKAMFFNYGLASIAQQTPVDQHTLFEVGSVSKTVTATLASYAQVQGKLSLANHPSRYLPQLKGSALDRASLLHLATYTAGGLPQQFPDQVTNHQQMLAYLQNWKAEAEPGAMRRYSNPSLGLFGHVTALALNTGFADAVEHQLFPQLGMKESYIRVPAAAMGRYAWGYDGRKQPVRVKPDVLDGETYGVKSSAADMIRFVQLNIDPSSLSAPMRRAIEGTQLGYFQVGDTVQGLGWEQYRPPLALARLLAGNGETMSRAANPAVLLSPPQAAPPATWFNKTGATRGFGAYVAFVPERRIGIVMLANKAYPAAARVTAAHAILERLAPELGTK